MEEFANEFHAVILDEDASRDAVLVNQVINVLALDGFLFRGFFFVEQFRSVLLRGFYYSAGFLKTILF